MKKIISFLLVLTLLLGMAPAALAVYASPGYFGKIAYEMKEDGTLTLTGEGTITSDDMGTTWITRRDDITTLIIGEGITAVGEWCFNDSEDLAVLSLPTTLEVIEEQAFSFCTKLQEVKIPYGVTTIGEKAFYYCKGLTKVTIPSSVTTIGSAAFDTCEKAVIYYEGTEEMWDEIDLGTDSAWMDEVVELHFNTVDTCVHTNQELVGQKTPTAWEEGYTGDMVCMDCLTVMEVGEVLDVIVHPFTDLESGSWYYDPVVWAYGTEVTTGMTETTFVPYGVCTRAQVVTFLWRAAGSPAPTTSVNPFTDVPSGQWFTDAVIWAAENGITTGTTSTTFAPNDKVLREQFVTFLWRVAGEPEQDDFDYDPFRDVTNSSKYYYDAVIWATRNGIANGVGGGKFGPQQECNRGQTVTFLHRYYEDAVLTDAATIALSNYRIELGEVYKINHTLSGVVLPDSAGDTPITWSSSDSSIATVDGDGKVKINSSGNASIIATAGGASASCQISPYVIDCRDYMRRDYNHMMNNYSITKVIEMRGGTYINLDGQRCVITMFMVQGYNALGGVVTDIVQTLHIVDTGDVIREPDEYYDDMADRYFGANKLHYMKLGNDYLGLQADFELFPAYYRNSYGLFEKY